MSNQKGENMNTEKCYGTCEPCTPEPRKPKLSDMLKENMVLLNEIEAVVIDIMGIVSNEEPTKGQFTEPCCIGENAYFNIEKSKGILDKLLRLKENL